METRLGAELVTVGLLLPSTPWQRSGKFLAIYFLRRFSALVSSLTVSFLAVSAFVFL